MPCAALSNNNSYSKDWPRPPPVDEEVFQLGKAAQVDLQLRITPASDLTHRAAAKTVLPTGDVLRTAVLLDHAYHKT